MLEILIIVVVLVFVWAISSQVLYNKTNKQNTQLNQSLIDCEKNNTQFNEQTKYQETKIQELTSNINQLNKDIEVFRQTQNNNLIALNTLEQQQKTDAEKITFLTQIKTQMTADFKSVANEVIEQDRQKIGQTTKQTLAPLQSEIQNFKNRIEAITTEQTKERASLLTQIQTLQETNLNTQQTTQNLTNALTFDNKKQGNWGELILENILSASGLRQGYEYHTQASFKNAEQQTLRPDVILHLPDEKDIIIDSKVSLKAYQEYVNSENKNSEDKSLLKQHIKSIEAHIDGISLKSYEQLEGIRSLDFIFVFMPVEPALLLALEEKPELFTKALSKNVMLTSPSTLTMSLKIVHHLWQTERQNNNTQEIVSQASRMYEKFALFNQSLEDIGKHLDKAQTSHQKAQNQLSSGKGNLISRAEKLQTLGIDAKKKLN